jgi:hypothetical protein
MEFYVPFVDPTEARNLLVLSRLKRSPNQSLATSKLFADIAFTSWPRCWHP